MFQVLFDVMKVNLLILHIVIDAKIFHILAAEKAQIIDRVGHVHDRFTDLSQTERDLQVVVPALVSRGELALAHKHSLRLVKRHLFRCVVRVHQTLLFFQERNICALFATHLHLGCTPGRECRILPDVALRGVRYDAFRLVLAAQVLVVGSVQHVV